MKFSTMTDGKTKIVEIFGSINKLDVEDLKEAFSGTEEYTKVVLDLTLVDFIDTGFINLLFSLKRSAPEQFKKVRLANPSSFVAEILHVTRVSEVCPIEKHYSHELNH